jgi:hypothetical protein
MTAPAPAVALRTTRILWLAILISTFLIVGMGELIRHVQPPPGEQPSALLPILIAAAAGALVASFVLPARTLRAALLRHELSVVEGVDPSAMPGAYRENAPKRRVFANPTKAERVAWLPYQAAFIMQVAMREAVALLGFPLLFFGASPVVWLPFFAVAWVTLGLAWPSHAKARRGLEQAYDAVLEAAERDESKK